MNQKPTYAELLRDPRWQRKRLEVMQRENFSCERCCAKEDTLNVHHGYYSKDMRPWEYDSETLHCLCEQCHKIVTDQMDKIKHAIAHISVTDLETIFQFLRGMSRIGDSNLMCINHINSIVVDHAMNKGDNDLYGYFQEAVNCGATKEALTKIFKCCTPRNEIGSSIAVEFMILRLSKICCLRSELLYAMYSEVRRWTGKK